MSPPVVLENPQAVGYYAAAEICALIRKNNALGRKTVLGFATGNTPLLTYKEMVRIHKEEGLSFERVVTFNLDEYKGLGPEDTRSYAYYMWENLFRHVNIPKDNIHLLNGQCLEEDVSAEVERYERAMRDHKIDIQLLGLGQNGHMAFNEPDLTFDSRTRLVKLHEQTLLANAPIFGGQVPLYALTVGIRTLLENTHRCILIATGDSKANIVRELMAVSGKPTPQLPASALFLHPNASFVFDRDAAKHMKVYAPPRHHALYKPVSSIVTDELDGALNYSQSM